MPGARMPATAPRCRSLPSPRCRSPPTSTRSRPATGGGGRRARRWCCAPSSPARGASTSTAPRPPGPGSSSRAATSPRRAASRRSSNSRSASQPFEDGGWIWFDITTDSDVTLRSAGWYSDQPAPGVANVAVGIPTFNRPNDCVNALRELTADPLVDKVIGAVIVPDQGTSKVRDHPDFAAAAAALGDRLSIHDQPNLGGSGGYSRVMYEALKNTDCQQILFMDDDIELQSDTILRILAHAPLRQGADAGGRPDAQPAGALAPAHHGRDGRPGELHVDRGAVHRVRPRLRRISR